MKWREHGRQVLESLAVAVLLWAYYAGADFLHRHFLVMVPAAVVGMLLLLTTLLLFGRVPLWIERGLQPWLRHFTLFLLPPTVGVLAVWPQVRAQAFPFLVTLLLATLIPLYFGAHAFRAFSRRWPR